MLDRLIDWQLREVAIDDGVKCADEFEAWLEFCHDRRLLFCDSISTANSQTDAIVVLRPAWLLDACQNLLSTDSRCCIGVRNGVSKEYTQRKNKFFILITPKVSGVL